MLLLLGLLSLLEPLCDGRMTEPDVHRVGAHLGSGHHRAGMLQAGRRPEDVHRAAVRTTLMSNGRTKFLIEIVTKHLKSTFHQMLLVQSIFMLLTQLS